MKTKQSKGNLGWILDEDRALRDLLDDTYVYDDKSKKRRVGVWFSHPDREVRDQRFPFITIDLVDFSEEMDRAERGTYTQPRDHNWASGMDYGRPELTDQEKFEITDWHLHVPTPIRLTYQVATWARNPMHDRQILQNLVQKGLLPFQRGSLDVSDGTVRRLDVLATNKQTFDEDGRKVFSNRFVVGISSEVPWEQLLPLRRVLEVRLKFRVTHDYYEEIVTKAPPGEPKKIEES